MIIIPAIDIRNGKCVRLFQGDFSQETIYNDDPIAVAKEFEKQGATILHVVDLDAAKDGKRANKTIIKKVVQSISIPVEVGGGIRDAEMIAELLSFGVARVVIGTAAFENESNFKKMLSRFANEIVVAIESKNNILMTRGWLKQTNKDIFTSAKELEIQGVKRFLFTDITKDGTLQEPNYKTLQKLLNITSVPIILSGGISSTVDIQKVKEINPEAIIIGKALYEKKFTIEEANSAC